MNVTTGEQQLFFLHLLILLWNYNLICTCCSSFAFPLMQERYRRMRGRSRANLFSKWNTRPAGTGACVLNISFPDCTDVAPHFFLLILTSEMRFKDFFWVLTGTNNRCVCVTYFIDHWRLIRFETRACFILLVTHSFFLLCRGEHL